MDKIISFVYSSVLDSFLWIDCIENSTKTTELFSTTNKNFKNKNYKLLTIR